MKKIIKTITLGRDVKINHYLSLNKGDELTFIYRNCWMDTPLRIHSWAGTVTVNRNPSYGTKTEFYMLNLWEYVDFDPLQFDNFFQAFSALKIFLEAKTDEEGIAFLNFIKKRFENTQKKGIEND